MKSVKYCLLLFSIIASFIMCFSCKKGELQEAEVPHPKTVVGEGATFEKALQSARYKALQRYQVPDGAINWRIKEITGVDGFISTQKIKVTLEIL